MNFYTSDIGIDTEKEEIRTAREAVNTFTLEETINCYFSSRSLKVETDYIGYNKSIRRLVR